MPFQKRKPRSGRAARFQRPQQNLERGRQNRLLVVNAVNIVRERVELVMRQFPLLHKLNRVYPLRF